MAAATMSLFYDEFVKPFAYFYSQGDPLYMLLIPYMLCQPLTMAFFRRTQFYEKNKDLCKKVMAGYNLVMAAYSFWVCCTAAYVTAFHVKQVWGAGHFAEPTGWYRFAVWTFYASKYLEFVDTYFLLLMCRPVSWLQYLHHIGAPLSMGLIYHSGCDHAWAPLVINGFIHTVMYYYYACCILKWRFPLPKATITSMQLVQFFSGFLIMGTYANIPAVWNDPYKRFALIFAISYVAMLVVLFSNFYYANYLKPKQDKLKAAAAGAASQLKKME